MNTAEHVWQIPNGGTPRDTGHRRAPNRSCGCLPLGTLPPGTPSAGRALVREAARAYVCGADRRIGPSAAKLFCTEMACRVADLAVQVHGGSGYMRSTGISTCT